MATPSHIPFLPVSWQGTAGEAWRKIATSTNNILKGGPFPAQWKDNLASFSSGRVAGANQPTWATFTNGIKAWSFSPTAMNELWLPFHINHDQAVQAGFTKLYPHIHWCPSDTGTGTVRWGLEYTYAKGHGQEAFPASTTIYLEQAGSGTALTHQIIETTDGAALDLANLETDGLLLCRVFRDAAHANDTYTAECFGLYADLHYQAQYLGTPQKSPGFFG